MSFEEAVRAASLGGVSAINSYLPVFTNKVKDHSMSSERFQKLAIKATQRGLIKSTPISTKDGNLATDPQSQFINNNCLKILNAMITPFKFGTTRAVVPIYSCTNLFSVI